MTVRALRRRFTVEEYHQIAKAGILSEDDRVELMEGEIVEMIPISSRHAACVDCLNHLISHSLGEAVTVRVQSPIHLTEHSEPQPDLALLKHRYDFYADKHPGPEDVLLVVEVAETSQEYDREVKIPHYAQAGIPEAWLVDLKKEMIESYSKPSPQGYKEVRKYQSGKHLTSHSITDLKLSVDDILG